VVLGPRHPTWRKLYEALAALAEACGGSFAFVLDTGNGLWCVGIPGQLREPGRVTRTGWPTVGLSFATIYAIVVWFDVAFEQHRVSAEIQVALPEIERLTLALPPWDDPGTDAGAARVRSRA
jgi:hypothetical protein